MFHFRNCRLFELILHGDPFDAHNLHVLPHILDADLDFPGNGLVQNSFSLSLTLSWVPKNSHLSPPGWDIKSTKIFYNNGNPKQPNL